MEYFKNFLGMNFMEDVFTSWKNTFIGPYGVNYDDEELYIESKEVFNHEEEGFPFKYKYVITAIQFDDILQYEVSLVPMPTSLHPEVRKKVADFCGIEESELVVKDVYDYGIYVCFGHHTTDNINGTPPFEEDVLNGLAYAVGYANRMRGFYLDRKINRVGNSGWDMLHMAIENKPLV